MRRDYVRCWRLSLALVVLCLCAATLAQHFTLRAQANEVAQLEHELGETRDLIARGGAIALGMWSIQYDADWREKMAQDLAKLQAAHQDRE